MPRAQSVAKVDQQSTLPPSTCIEPPSLSLLVHEAIFITPPPSRNCPGWTRAKVTPCAGRVCGKVQSAQDLNQGRRPLVHIIARQFCPPDPAVRPVLGVEKGSLDAGSAAGGDGIFDELPRPRLWASRPG